MDGQCDARPTVTFPAYLILPSGVDVLLPSAEASNGPNVHPLINHKFTKSPSLVLTWVHTNNGTIPPLQLITPTITHSQYLRENSNVKRKSTLVIMTFPAQSGISLYCMVTAACENLPRVGP